jgi:Mg2+ and Co2+ transporter CorA
MIEICNQLRRHHFSASSSAIRPYLRDVHDHVLLVNEAIVDLRERLTAAFEASLLLPQRGKTTSSKSSAAGPPYWRCRRR